MPRKKVKSLRISTIPSIDGNRSKATSRKLDAPVSGGAYQDARRVTLEWNARPKHRCLPEFRGRKHQTASKHSFLPPSFLLREKRWGRRRRVRNDHDGTNPCRQGFLSSVLVSSFPNRKLNLRFGFYRKFATTSQSRLRRASSHARGALFIPPAAASPCAADNIHIPSHPPAPTRSGSPPKCRSRRPALPADTPAPRARRAR